MIFTQVVKIYTLIEQSPLNVDYTVQTGVCNTYHLSIPNPFYTTVILQYETL